MSTKRLKATLDKLISIAQKTEKILLKVTDETRPLMQDSLVKVTALRELVLSLPDDAALLEKEAEVHALCAEVTASLDYVLKKMDDSLASWWEKELPPS